MRIVDKGNDIIIEGHLYSLVCDTIGTATIKVYEDNTYLTSVTTDEYGFFHIVIPTSTVGVRNFKLIYEGDSNYTGSESTTIEVTVRDAPVLDEILLVSDTLVCQLGERFHFTATCQSQYDDDLANIQVQLKKDGTTIQTVTTGTDGKAYLKFTPNATGSYSITATSGNVSSDPILVVVSEGNIYEIIADLNEFPGTYSKEEIDALLLALKTLLEESKADVGHIHQIGDIPNLQALLDDKVTWEAFYNSGGGSSVDIATSWGNPTSDSKVPSEKLTKTSLDDKISKSSTNGLMKNDGTVDTTSYLSSLPSHTHDDRYYTESEMDTALNGKQATLISGTNIKTINNTSLLGSGNINIQGGGTVTIDDSLSTTSTNPVQNKVITGALNGKANSSHTHTSSQVTDLIDVIYPVGSIYMSVNSVNPSTLFGGTWEQIEDTFLLASGSSYSNGSTGGSADAVVVSHNHSTNTSGEYFVTSENSDSNNTRVSYNASGNRYVDGMNASTTPFHHRVGTNYVGVSATGKNMPPYLVVNVWKRTA